MLLIKACVLIGWIMLFILCIFDFLGVGDCESTSSREKSSRGER